jgi:hypothetical protein
VVGLGVLVRWELEKGVGCCGGSGDIRDIIFISGIRTATQSGYQNAT